MRATLIALIALCLAGAAIAQEQQNHGAGASLGTVNFQTSCAPAVQADFDHAVALLHSFEYDEARDAFLAVAKKDPTCAMAYWGAAMTYFHGLWGEVDVENGAKMVAMAADAEHGDDTVRPETRKDGISSQRTSQYIGAVAAIYHQANATVRERSQAFSEAMAKVHEANPADVEATIFYALSLAESAGPDPSYANQRKCGELLEPLFQKMPNHPGIAHYLIHCDDNPVLAPKGLEAARAYAKIAPDSGHATHMPSHIFVRLGMWEDNNDSNLLSIRAAQHHEAEYPCQSRGSELHAMHFLQFGYLQQGRQKDAKQVVDHALALPPLKQGCGRYAAEILADYILETHDWSLAEQLAEVAPAEGSRRSADVQLALGIAAARRGKIEEARSIEQAMGGAGSHMGMSNPMMTGAEIAHQELSAWIADAEGKHSEAAQQLRAAADTEDAHDPSTWASPIAREMLAELLLQQGKDQEALAEFRAVLKQAPNLYLALTGAAEAAERAGDRGTAIAYYRKLTEIAGNGDRPEIAVARKKLQESKVSGGGR